jgi:phosphoesterase RecJ-like protein
LALGTILKLMGKKVTIYCQGAVPPYLKFLPGFSEIKNKFDTHETFDIAIALDTGGENQLPFPMPDKTNIKTFVVIDHHINGALTGDITIRKPLSSVGELLFNLTQQLLWPVNKEIATCLYTSIVSDTGSFRYPGTKAETHKVAAQLLEFGVEPWKVSSLLFESYSPSRQKLLGKVADTLTLFENGKIAVVKCTKEMMDACEASKEDLDGLVHIGKNISGVEIAIMVSEYDKTGIKLSLRSTHGNDISTIAKSLGGGGHANAAGATVTDQSLANVLSYAVQQSAKLLNDTNYQQ